MKKIKALLVKFKNEGNSILLPISVLLSCIFLLSPFLLRYQCFFITIDSFFESLKYTGYKEAFIGASGGMIGSFLAITGALWVERKLSKDNEKKEIEKIAAILYYDIKLFYKELSPLSTNIAWIMGIPDKEQQRESYIIYKNNAGVHIHSDWITLVASLKAILKKEEIEQIYTFYGNVSDIKLLIEKDNLEAGIMGRVNSAINNLGIKVGSTYLPNKEYAEILNHLKQIAKIEETVKNGSTTIRS